ncbi:hypothetical protein [Streptomyces sp. NBC_01013]|nr:hypothetical protein OG538_35595 [Streptomyces sp. NBC_01013]
MDSSGAPPATRFLIPDEPVPEEFATGLVGNVLDGVATRKAPASTD